MNFAITLTKEAMENVALANLNTNFNAIFPVGWPYPQIGDLVEVSINNHLFFLAVVGRTIPLHSAEAPIRYVLGAQTKS